jgi:hypothetical protein
MTTHISWKISDPGAPCMEYLPTKLGHKNGVNVGEYSILGS